MGIVKDSVAFNEGGNPEPQPWAEWFVCGPNTTPSQAQAIRNAGSKLIVKVQPVAVLLPDGTRDLFWPWYRSLSLIPGLYCTDGTPSSLDAPGEGMAGRIVLQFNANNVPHQMAKLVGELAASLGAVGVVQDYGCLNVSGFGNCYKVDPVIWPLWGTNYTVYIGELMSRYKLKVWRCCSKQFSPGAALCMEGISLYGQDQEGGWPPSVRQAADNCAKYPGSILLVQKPDAYLRQAIVTAARANGGYVDYRPDFYTGDRVTRTWAPELTS